MQVHASSAIHSNESYAEGIRSHLNSAISDSIEKIQKRMAEVQTNLTKFAISVEAQVGIPEVVLLIDSVKKSVSIAF